MIKNTIAQEKEKKVHNKALGKMNYLDLYAQWG